MTVTEFKNVVPESITHRASRLVQSDDLHTDVVLGESIYTIDHHTEIDPDIKRHMSQRYYFLHDFLDNFITRYLIKSERVQGHRPRYKFLAKKHQFVPTQRPHRSHQIPHRPWHLTRRHQSHVRYAPDITPGLLDNKTVLHRSDLTYPGFHVIRSDTARSEYNWHIDNALCGRYRFIDARKILSILIPIELNPGAHLAYRTGNYKHHLPYRVGNVYMWPCELEHCIGVGSFPEPTDVRITYQCHIYISDSVIWVFF